MRITYSARREASRIRYRAAPRKIASVAENATEPAARTTTAWKVVPCWSASMIAPMNRGGTTPASALAAAHKKPIASWSFRRLR